MKVSLLLRRYRALRWLLPAGVALAAGLSGMAATGAFTTAASSQALPVTTPRALVAAMDSAKVSGFSGTVVTRMSLGLPDLGSLGGDAHDASMTALLSGSHTLRFWYGGPDRQRIALLGATSESDVFRNGTDLWQWDSATRVALHTVLPSSTAPVPAAPSAAPSASVLASLTPRQVAQRLLDKLRPSTDITVERGSQVADRATYALVLTPRDPHTRVGSVRIDIDGKVKMPIAVRVYARGHSTPSIDVAFTSVTFKMPADKYFAFTPPPGATVHEAMPTRGAIAAPSDPKLLAGFGQHATTSGPWHVTGSGWSTVVEYRASPTQVRDVAGPLVSRLPYVSGQWGSGRLLSSPLVCVLVTDDGRVLAGAVDPTALYAAAAR